MNNLRRYYNQNRKKIWGIVIIIASAILLLQVANFFAKKSNEEKLSNTTNTTEQTVNFNTNTSTLTTNQSVVSGENVGETQLKNATEAIDKFVNYCNSKDLQSAYDMLTEECKEQMYSSVQLFETAYYNNNFGGQSKKASIENWTGNTYKVRIMEDMLTTGGTNNGEAKQDYITVKKVDDTYKLNINNYIGYSTINKITEEKDIQMEVVSKNTYMEQEEYKIEVTNNTDYTIVVDPLYDAEAIYLEDENGMQYTSYNHELTNPMLEVQSGHTKELTIKFYSSYTSTKNIEYIVFSDLRILFAQDMDEFEFRARV